MLARPRWPPRDSLKCGLSLKSQHAGIAETILFFPFNGIFSVVAGRLRFNDFLFCLLGHFSSLCTKSLDVTMNYLCDVVLYRECVFMMGSQIIHNKRTHRKIYVFF